MAEHTVSLPVAWTNPEGLRKLARGFGAIMSPTPEMHPEGETPLYTADQMRAAIKATRALALEEAARECEAEAEDFVPAWSGQAIAAAEACAERIRALIGKEPT